MHSLGDYLKEILQMLHRVFLLSSHSKNDLLCDFVLLLYLNLTLFAEYFLFHSISIYFASDPPDYYKI